MTGIMRRQSTKPLGVGIIGCGNIATHYAADLISYPEIKLVGAADVDATRAQALAAKQGIHAYRDVAELLADSEIKLVVNLTVPDAHKAISSQALAAGKHVYSEKPLTLSYADSAALLAEAAERGLRIGCSPFTLMGESAQTAWKFLREGKVGRVRLIYAEMNHGRIETWHPAPESFYEVGPLFDVGVYPLTMLVAMFGAAKRLQTFGTILKTNRTRLDGTKFQPTAPDYLVTTLELERGTVVRLTTNFYVGAHNKQGSGIEFHGDEGSLYLGQAFGGDVEYAPYGGSYETLPLVRNSSSGIPWGRGVWEMIDAISQDRPHRFTGQMAAHITEILGAAVESTKTGGPVTLKSRFTPPTPMEWAE